MASGSVMAVHLVQFSADNVSWPIDMRAENLDLTPAKGRTCHEQRISSTRP